MAMKFSHALFGLGVLALSAAPALAKPAYVVSTVNLRAGPGKVYKIRIWSTPVFNWPMTGLPCRAKP